MKRILILGGAGFIGHHLARRLKKDGNTWVRVVDIKDDPNYLELVDDYMQLDLREYKNCQRALTIDTNYKYNMRSFDEVYQLAADMGGMGFISNHDVDCLTNNALININMVKAATEAKVGKYFFSSSVCVYRDMKRSETLDEWDVYPARPDNEYGWEKLYSERVVSAYGLAFPDTKVRIARFQNVYGPECAWNGGREKAPAAICRKVSKSKDGGSVNVWGDGSAIRNFVYIDDLVEGVIKLTRSLLIGPTIIGTYDKISVENLTDEIIKVSGKKIEKNYVKGPVGVANRSFDKTKIMSIGWKPKVKFSDGIKKTYEWVNKQVHK